MDIQHSPINIAIPLTYDMFFDDKPKGIIEYLTGINRYKLVKLALCIINSYKLLRQFNKFWDLSVLKIIAISVNIDGAILKLH